MIISYLYSLIWKRTATVVPIEITTADIEGKIHQTPITQSPSAKPSQLSSQAHLDSPISQSSALESISGEEMPYEIIVDRIPRHRNKKQRKKKRKW